MTGLPLIRKMAGWRIGIVAVAVSVLAACGGDMKNPESNREQAAPGTIEGEVFYRERMALPPGVSVHVQLEDISRADALATVIASVSMNPEGGPPYPFSIEYDPAQIDARMRYALRATIHHEDKLLFTNMEFIDAFSGNPVKVLVQRVPEPVAVNAPTLESTQWLLDALEGEPAPLGMGGKSVSLSFDAQEQRAGGFSGCNRYSGGFERQGSATHGSPLTFGPMAGTLMACPEGEELERRYLKILGEVDSFRLDGGALLLLTGDRVMATFKPS